MASWQTRAWSGALFRAPKVVIVDVKQVSCLHVFFQAVALAYIMSRIINDHQWADSISPTGRTDAWVEGYGRFDSMLNLSQYGTQDGGPYAFCDPNVTCARCDRLSRSTCQATLALATLHRRMVALVRDG